MRKTTPLFTLLCLLPLGCRDKDQGLETGTLDSGDSIGIETGGETASESGSETGGDTSGFGEAASQGFAFCAGGGWVSGTDLHGVTCTAPLDIATARTSSDTLTWQPGPITFIAP